MIASFEKFLDAALLAVRPTGSWFKINHVEVYVRVGRFFLNHTSPVFALVVANLSVIEPERGRGYFTILLNSLIELALKGKFEVIYFENIDDKRMLRFLVRNGFTAVHSEYHMSAELKLSTLQRWE